MLNIKSSKILKFAPIIVLVVFISYRDSTEPQRVLDVGLFLSNQLNYSPNSLMYESYSNSFTLLHYLAALMLNLNLEILKISFIFQLINLLVFSISIFLINTYYKLNLFFNYFAIFISINALPYFLKNLTFVYPLTVSTEHTYGQFGISLSLFAIALVIYNKLNYFFTLIPYFLTIHLGWGITTTLVLLCFILIQKNNFKFSTKNSVFFLFSLLTTLPFWLHYLILKNEIVPNPLNSNISNLYDNYINNWDYHRSFDIDIYKIKFHLIILFLIFLMLLLNLFLKFKIQEILIIVGLNSILALILTVLDFVVFDKKFIWLNTFMPGKIINLSLFLYIVIFFILLNKILDRLYVLVRPFFNNKIVFFTFFSFLLFLLFIMNLENFNYRNLYYSKLNFYNPKLDKPICEFLKETDSSIVTIGNASRILPLTCRKKILIDTTQIDFIPYSKNSLPKLKNIMEDVYGLIFSSRIDSSNIVNHLSKPIGAIDENIVRKIWETRSVSTWKELGCQYNFQYLVLPKNFRIQLNPILISDSLVLYYVEKNCLNTSKKFVGDFLSSLPIEYTDRQFFYWQTEKPSTFYLKNINVDATNVYLYLTFLPNPCKNRYEININYNLNNYSIEVGDKLKNYQLIMVSNPGNYQKLIISLKGFQKECVIKNEVRTLVTQISNISIQ